MVTARIEQGNGRRAVYYQLLMATIVVAYLVTSGNCLPNSNAKQPFPVAEELIKETKASELGIGDQELRVQLRKEENNNEKAIVAALDKLEGNLDEGAGSSDRTAHKSGAISSVEKRSDKDNEEEEMFTVLDNVKRNVDEAVGSSDRTEHKSDAISSDEKRSDKDEALAAEFRNVAKHKGKEIDAALDDFKSNVEEVVGNSGIKAKKSDAISSDEKRSSQGECKDEDPDKPCQEKKRNENDWED